MRDLSARIAPDQVVVCDGGPYDAFWLAWLAKAAGIELDFELIDVAVLLADEPDVIRRFFEGLAETPATQSGVTDVSPTCG